MAYDLASSSPAACIDDRVSVAVARMKDHCNDQLPASYPVTKGSHHTFILMCCRIGMS